MAATGTLMLEYFVKSFEGLQMDSSALSEQQTNDGQSLDSAFNFLQQVFYDVYKNQDPKSYESVEVTVWMTNSDHFFFTCSKDKFGEPDGFYNQVDSVTVFCDEIEGLKAIQPTTDNVDFVIMPMKCTKQSIFEGKAGFDATVFRDLCVEQQESAWPSRNGPWGGPYLNVLDSYSYFNITRSAVFEDIYFRGEHALAQPTVKTIHPAYVPTKKCEVVAEPTGEHVQLELEPDENASTAIAYECRDAGFQNVVLPMEDEEDCEENTQTTIKSVRSCPGEPYHEDFFVRDSESELFFKRHKVLFNLYNFDGLSAMHPDNVTTLTLKNCTFQYFLDDYEALIHIENNNLAPFNVDDSGVAGHFAYLGSARGANLQINKSRFRHSRFCKGMIVSKRRPYLGFFASSGSLIIDNDFQYDGIMLSQDPMINITDSEFVNLNYGHAINTLSQQGMGTLPMSGHPEISYEPFDNHGSVLNLQGFPGKVAVYNSDVFMNFAFVPDIYPSKRGLHEPVESLVHYLNPNFHQFSTTRCLNGKVRRLFSNFLTSVNEHPDAMMSQLEKYSAIFIGNSIEPMIIRKSNFTQNIGLFGGAISVDNPDFQFDNANLVTYTQTAFRPYIVLQDNEFSRNQAYSSGNAVYVRSTRGRYDISELEQQRVCGQFYAELNTFSYNRAILKSHNGGAISVSCDFVDLSDPRFAGRASDFHYNNYDRRESVSDIATDEQVVIYRQAIGIKNNTFISNSAGQKGTAIYARQVSNFIVYDNIFELNTPHYTYFDEKKELESPYYEFLALKQRPISFHDSRVIAVNDLSSAYVSRFLTRSVEDEFEYMQILATSYEEGGLIDMPQAQGAIYFESCYECLVSYELSQYGCDFCYGLRQHLDITGNKFINNQAGIGFYDAHKLPRASQIYIHGGLINEIKDNLFRDIVSDFWIKVWRDSPSYNITMPDSYWKSQEAPLIRVKIPEGYGRYIDYTQFHELDDDLFLNKRVSRFELPDANTEQVSFWPEWLCGESCYNFTSISNTTFELNLFIGIETHEPILLSQEFKGSLIQFESDTRHARLTITRNGFEDDFIRGSASTYSSLIYAYGGAVTMDSNLFIRCGHLDNTYITFIQNDTRQYARYTEMSNRGADDPDKVAEIFVPDYFPINTNRNTSQQYTQFAGMLTIEGGPVNARSNFSKPILHQLRNNTFNFLFCKRGCVYQQIVNDRSEPSYLNFTWNNYRNIFGEQAAVMYTEVLDQSDSMIEGANSTYTVHNFTYEEFVNIQNGALTSVGYQQEVAQIFSHIFFDNIFGSADSPTILIDKGAFYSCYNCTFLEGSFAARKIINVQEEFVDENFFQLITRRREFTDYVSQSSLNQTFPLLQHGSKGSVILKQMAKKKVNGTVTHHDNHRRLGHEPEFQKVVDPFPNNSSYGLNPQNITFKQDDSIVTLADLMNDTYGSMLQYPETVIRGVTFENLVGDKVGVFYLEDGSLSLDNCTFRNNEATAEGGSNVVAVNSFLNLTNVFFDRNKGSYGGAIYVKEQSYLNISGCTFYQNFASEQAGAIMVETDSQVQIFSSIFKENSAQSHGSVMVASNCHDRLISVRNSLFKFNQAVFSLATLVNSEMEVYDTKFDDNLAISLTHGFSLTNSRLTASSIQVTSSRHSQSDQTSVLAGFFYLTEGSQLSLIGDSTIQHISGKIATAILLQAESKLFIQDTQFLDIVAISSGGFEPIGVIVAQQSQSMIIDQSIFSGNMNTDIYSDRTPVIVTKSLFMNGRQQPYVKVMGSSLALQSSKLRNNRQPVIGLRNLEGATEETQPGGGVQCLYCSRLQAFNNEFENLEGLRGAAMYIADSKDARIERNMFTNNIGEQGGALYILHSNVDIKNNHFEGNSAEARENQGQTQSKQHEGAGGAIYFTCVDVLDDASIYDPNDEEQKDACKVSLSQNRFWDNSATNKGGALMHANTNFTFPEEDSNDFKDNQAKLGGEIASPPGSISIEIVDSDFARVDPLPPVFNPEDSDNFLDQTIAKRVEAAFEIVSGISFSLVVKVLDQEGHLYKDDSTSTALIEFYEEVPEYGVIRGNQAIAQEGVYVFDTLRVNMRPESRQYMQITLLNLASYGNQQTFLLAPVIMEFSARQCIHGEKFTEERTCVQCPIGFYSYTIQSEPYECLPCPRNAVCPGDNIMIPKAGYVRMHEVSIVFIRCFLQQACLLGEKTDVLGKCAEGYQGVMCAACADGSWKRTNTFECSECTNTGITANFFLLVQWVFFSAFMYYLVQLFFRNLKRMKQQTIPLFRIFFNYYHFLSILSKMEEIQSYSTATKTFTAYFKTKLFFTTPVEWLMDISCIATYNLTVEDKFYAMLVLHFMLPVVIFLVNAILWTLTALCCARSSKGDVCQRIRRQWNSIIASTGMCLFMVYPNMIEFFLTSVKCFDSLEQTPGDIQIQRLRNLPSITCFEGRHLAYTTFVTLPALLIWLFIFPMFVICKMKSHSETISKSNLKPETLSTADRKNVSDIKTQFGFFFVGLKTNIEGRDPDEEKEQFKKRYTKYFSNRQFTFVEEIRRWAKYLFAPISGKGARVETGECATVQSFYYWEAIVFVEKVLLYLIVIFYTEVNQGLQANLCLLFVAIFFVIQSGNKPYESTRLNRLHAWGLGVLLLVIYSRIVIQSFGLSASQARLDNIVAGEDVIDPQIAQIERSFSLYDWKHGIMIVLIVIFVIIVTLIYDIYFLTKLYIQFLIYLVEKNQNRAFHNFTINLCDLGSFRAQYVDRNAQFSDEEEELSRDIATETQQSHSHFQSEDGEEVSIPSSEINDSRDGKIIYSGQGEQMLGLDLQPKQTDNSVEPVSSPTQKSILRQSSLQKSQTLNQNSIYLSSSSKSQEPSSSSSSKKKKGFGAKIIPMMSLGGTGEAQGTLEDSKSKSRPSSFVNQEQSRPTNNQLLSSLSQSKSPVPSKLKTVTNSVSSSGSQGSSDSESSDEESDKGLDMPRASVLPKRNVYRNEKTSENSGTISDGLSAKDKEMQSDSQSSEEEQKQPKPKQQPRPKQQNQQKKPRPRSNKDNMAIKEASSSDEGELPPPMINNLFPIDRQKSRGNSQRTAQFGPDSRRESKQQQPRESESKKGGIFGKKRETSNQPDDKQAAKYKAAKRNKLLNAWGQANDQNPGQSQSARQNQQNQGQDRGAGQRDRPQERNPRSRQQDKKRSK